MAPASKPLRPDPHSCWECGWQQIGGDSFLGLCKWFETKGQPKKAIPPTVVDVGCKYWKLTMATTGVPA